MSLPDNDFYVYLPYSTKNDHTGKKNLSSFITALDPAIDLREQRYEVALTQINGETSVYNVGDDSRVVFNFIHDKYVGSDPKKKLEDENIRHEH